MAIERDRSRTPNSKLRRSEPPSLRPSAVPRARSRARSRARARLRAPISHLPPPAPCPSPQPSNGPLRPTRYAWWIHRPIRSSRGWRPLSRAPPLSTVRPGPKPSSTLTATGRSICSSKAARQRIEGTERRRIGVRSLELGVRDLERQRTARMANLQGRNPIPLSTDPQPQTPTSALRSPISHLPSPIPALPPSSP